MATIASSRATSTDTKSAFASDALKSHPYTCNTCQVAFRGSELQRGHMRSDWHRYNLKRRVATLPPLTSDVFVEKVLTAQAVSKAAAAKASFERVCGECQKTYYSENAYQNHLGSQKHRLRATALEDERLAPPSDEAESVMGSTISLGEPIDMASVVSNDPEADAEFSEVVHGLKDASIEDPKSEPFSRRPTRPHHSAHEDRPEHPLSQTVSQATIPSNLNESESPADSLLKLCLFCNRNSSDLKLNLHHMTTYHGLFIPEQAYLVDLEGLICYLRAKINENYECIYCHRLKNSPSGIQLHMKDKGHCMIAFDSEEDMVEIGQYYDFSSTYSDTDDYDEDTYMEDTRDECYSGDGVGLRVRHPPAVKSIASALAGDHEMGDGDENDDGWETDSSVDSVFLADRVQGSEQSPAHRQRALFDRRSHRGSEVFRSDCELHLPSGRTAGHRSLARYYRQNLRNYPSPAERVERQMITDGASSPDTQSGGLIQNEARGRQLAMRENGGAGMLGVTDAKRREVRAAEKRVQKQEHRARQQYQWGINKRANRQEHFRDPLLQ